MSSISRNVASRSQALYLYIIYSFLFLLFLYINIHVYLYYIYICFLLIYQYIISVAFSNTICGSSNFTCSNQSMYAYIYLFCYKLFISETYSIPQSAVNSDEKRSKKTFLLVLKKQYSICGFAVCSDEKRSKKIDI